MKTLKIKVLITVLFIVTILGIAGAVVAESRQVAGAATAERSILPVSGLKKGTVFGV